MSTGARRPVVVPSPICPWLLLPQHFTRPGAVIAHEWFPPPAIRRTTVVARPETSTAVSAMLLPRPSPGCPLLPRPQHLAPPAVIAAQVCRSPVAIAATPLVSPVTSKGAV